MKKKLSTSIFVATFIASLHLSSSAQALTAQDSIHHLSTATITNIQKPIQPKASESQQDSSKQFAASQVSWDSSNTSEQSKSSGRRTG